MFIIPFSCDAVGSLMGRAWRKDFFERFDEILKILEAKRPEFDSFIKNRVASIKDIVIQDNVKNGG